MRFFPHRTDRAELLDEPDAPRQQVERSLRDLRRINAWLGGIRVYRALIRRHAPGARSILDIGTGTSDLLVSMHVNGFDRPSPTAVGYETWYTGSRPFGEQSERFATLVFRALGEEMTAAGYAAIAREINNDDEISVDASDPALADHMIMTGPEVRGAIGASQMPGAIVESLFISNDADASFLASETGHDAIVAAYEAAIVQYFNEVPG